MRHIISFEVLALVKEKLKLGQDCHVKSCYEVGRDGLWIHRYLVE